MEEKIKETEIVESKNVIHQQQEFKDSEVGKQKSSTQKFETYSSLLYSFLLGGPLTWKKETILQDVRNILRIPSDFHKKEFQRIEK